MFNAMGIDAEMFVRTMVAVTDEELVRAEHEIYSHLGTKLGYGDRLLEVVPLSEDLYNHYSEMPPRLTGETIVKVRLVRRLPLSVKRIRSRPTTCSARVGATRACTSARRG